MRSSSLTLAGQVKIASVCLMAVKHLQRVFAFVILGRVQDFNPDLLHGAASLRPDILVNPLIPTQKEGMDTFAVFAATTRALERDLWKPSVDKKYSSLCFRLVALSHEQYIKVINK